MIRIALDGLISRYNNARNTVRAERVKKQHTLPDNKGEAGIKDEQRGEEREGSHRPLLKHYEGKVIVDECLGGMGR